jgi:hypothetical protein
MSYLNLHEFAKTFIQQCCDHVPYQFDFNSVCQEIEDILNEKTICGDDDVTGYWEIRYFFGPHDLSFINKNWWDTYNALSYDQQKEVHEYLKNVWPDTWRR